jgi:hypothetical protein
LNVENNDNWLNKISDGHLKNLSKADRTEMLAHVDRSAASAKGWYPDRRKKRIERNKQMCNDPEYVQKRTERLSKPVAYEGIYYPSKKHLHKAFGHTAGWVDHMLRTGKVTFAQTLEESLQDIRYIPPE